MRLWLRNLRLSAGLSQKEVAQKAGITHQFYNYIENNTRHPSRKTAKNIASVLGFHWLRFYLEEDEETASRERSPLCKS